MLNQGFFEDEDRSSQIGFFPLLCTNFTSLPVLCSDQSLKTLSSIPPLLQLDDAESVPLSDPEIRRVKDGEYIASNFAGISQLFSLQNSSINYCIKRSVNGGDEKNLGVLPLKMKKIKARRNAREPRFCFKTMSDVDVLDDGYKWRKYGQKVVKNTQHPRSYYRCTQCNCRVKKRVERLAEDPRMVITTYEGRHTHIPSHDKEDPQPSSQFSSFLW